MPFAEATLEVRAEEYRWDARRLLEAFKSVCRPLVAVHAQDVYHRDLKPANVLIIGNEIAVSAFGIARIAVEGGAGLTQAALGDPTWCAPEQIMTAGTRDADARTDICQLGKTLYWLFTGKTPLSMECDRLPPLR